MARTRAKPTAAALADEQHRAALVASRVKAHAAFEKVGAYASVARANLCQHSGSSLDELLAAAQKMEANLVEALVATNALFALLKAPPVTAPTADERGTAH